MTTKTFTTELPPTSEDWYECDTCRQVKSGQPGYVGPRGEEDWPYPVLCPECCEEFWAERCEIGGVD